MSGVPLICMPDVFSCKGVKQQGLRGCAGVPASGSFRPSAGGTVQAKRAIFLGVKLMFVIVVNFSHVQLLRFVTLKNFWSCSNPNFGHIGSVM